MASIMQSLWIGGELSILEKLSMVSFVRHGHPYHLYLYHETTNVPDGVIVKDANDVLPERVIFLSLGSYATFSDWFRWELLYKNGNYWVDTDVVCLKPLDLTDEIVFGRENYDMPNVSVLKFPKGHAFSRFMADNCEDPNRILPYNSRSTKIKKYFRKYMRGNKRSNQGWGESGGPRGFKDALIHFGLLELGKPFTFFYPIPYGNWRHFFDETLKNDVRLFSDTYALHLWNDGIKREKNFDKNARFAENSLIEQLKRRYLPPP